MRQGTVEVSVEVSFFSFDYAHHLNIFPAVLLAPVSNRGIIGECLLAPPYFWLLLGN